MRIVSFFICLFCFITTIEAQYIYRGAVVDAKTNESLIGANLLVIGTKTGTTTDYDGAFSFDSKNPTITFKVSYLGYESIEVVAQPDKILEIKLAEVKVQVLLPGPIIYTTPIEHTIPAPVFSINLNVIESNSNVSPEPILNQAPGVLMHTGAYNTNRITLRGIGNRSQFSTSKIRAYLDDIPLTTGVGETTIEDLDMSLFQKMRIYKGPAAVTNGAGLGGLIELKTGLNGDIRRSNRNRGLKTSFQVGSFGLLRNVNQFTYQKRKLFLVANASITHSDGYRENNGYDRQSFTLLARYGNSFENRTTLFGNFTSLKAFIPSSLSREDYDNDPSAAAFTWNKVKGFEDYDKILLGLSHSHLVWMNSEKRLNLYNITSLFASNYDSYESRPFNILQEQTLAVGGRTKFQLRHGSTIGTHNYIVGLELFQDNYDWTTNVTNDGIIGDLLSDNEELRNYYNLFAKYELRHRQDFRVSAGVNLNNTKYNLTDLFNPDSTSVSGDYAFESILSPQLGFLYNLNRRYAVYASISHGFSPPSLEETLTPDGQINNDIRPEQGWNFEIGSRFNSGSKKLNYDIAFFSMHINDLLVAERVAEDQYVGINAGKTIHNGLEVFLHYNWFQSVKHHLYSDLSYTFSDFKFDEFVDEDNDYSGNKLTGTPSHTANFFLRYSYDRSCYVNFNFRFVDKMPMRDDNSIYSEAFNVLNTKVGYKKFFGKFGIDFHAGINNLLNEKYASMILINAGSFGGNPPRYYYPGLPRNYYTGIALKYKMY